MFVIGSKTFLLLHDMPPAGLHPNGKMLDSPDEKALAVSLHVTLFSYVLIL